MTAQEILQVFEWEQSVVSMSVSATLRPLPHQPYMSRLLSAFVPSKQTQYIDRVLFRCSASVGEGGSTSIHHWVDVLCRLGSLGWPKGQHHKLEKALKCVFLMFCLDFPGIPHFVMLLMALHVL